jgi:16S rRNA (uracil1498-N3)-methyltransferase
MALDNGYIPVSLGHTRLRTETAALAACHGVVFLND